MKAKKEIDLIYDELADIRDNLFTEEDFTLEDGFDLTGSYVGSPYEVLGGVRRKLERQQALIEKYEAALEGLDMDMIQHLPDAIRNCQESCGDSN